MVLGARPTVLILIVASAEITRSRAIGIGAGRRCFGQIERKDGHERDAEQRDPTSYVEAWPVSHVSPIYVRC